MTVIFALFEHPKGVATPDGPYVVYDLERDVASLGAAEVAGPALVWTLGDDREPALPEGVAALSVDVDLGPEEWLARCDRVDFPPGGVAHRHVHPGPGIRRLLFGELTIESPDGVHTYGAGDAWFEGSEHPVLATASAAEDTAFVRVLLLPREWEGKRTIRYLDPADEAKPKLQRATVYLEQAIAP